MRILGLLATVLAASLMLAACSSGGDDDDATLTPTGTADETPGEVTIADLARSVVQIQALDGGEAAWSGSGTIISASGLILTNAHVIDDRFGEYDTLAIGITKETDEAPEPEFSAEIVAVDYSLDLALVQITGRIDGGVTPDDFPFVRLGDSDEIEIGDGIRILGYPGIGGETITFTGGVVSGFTAERSVGSRAWIKTDATIAGGNSGGLAVNDAGEIIGVPTVVGSGAGADTGYVDCRVLEDTNNDGFLDERDTCVTVGGFINGLRPVGLATDMIASAEAGEEYVSPYYEEEFVDVVPGDFDASAVDLSNLIFSTGVTSDDRPTDVLALIPSNPLRVCGFWDYEGMQDGMTWDALWYVDGELSEGGSIIADTWVGGEAGNWWVCLVDEEFGLPDGVYELVLQVEGDPTASDAVHVSDDRDLIQLDIVNESSVEICGVWVSPTVAQNWGNEDLGPTATILPGDFWPLFIASGSYDVLMLDCNADTLVEDYGLDILEDGVYTVTGDAGDSGGSLDNPVPLGQSGVLVDSVEVSVVDVNFDAWALVEAENIFNDPPEPGKRMVLIRLEFTNVGSDPYDIFFDPGFSLAGDKAVVYDEFADSCGVIPDRVTGEIFPGGTKQGNICLQVDIDDSGLAAILSDFDEVFDDQRLFLALE